MKRILTLAILLAGTLTLSAQDSEAILKKIVEKAPQSISSGFTEVRSSTANPRDATTLTGTLEFKSEDFLSMSYDNSELFEIDGQKMTMVRNGKKQSFDLAKNKMMQGLSHLLLFAFQGRVKELSEEQGTTLLVSTVNGEYVVTLAAKEKAPRGYMNATFRYSTSTGRIKSMDLVEFNGKSTSYELK